jgi:hypothetical protein
LRATAHAEFNNVTVRGTLSTTTVRETITVGASAITGDIRSFGYTAGTSGWQIESDGSAEFNDVTVRGEFADFDALTALDNVMVAAIKINW